MSIPWLYLHSMSPLWVPIKSPHDVPIVGMEKGAVSCSAQVPWTHQDFGWIVSQPGPSAAPWQCRGTEVPELNAMLKKLQCVGIVLVKSTKSTKSTNYLVYNWDMQL
jgi:hypothetical protein